jgi:hypothetical protein
MAQILSTLRKGGRAAVVALVLGTASVTAIPTPAMAQPGPSFQFRLDLGVPGGSFRFRDRDFDQRRFCLSNSQIVRGLRQHGFRDVDIVRDNRRRVEVIARYGRAWYLLQVNRCSGQVQIIERIRRGFPDRRFPQGGFGLQFNFGM